jgi:hypothetical protein
MFQERLGTFPAEIRIVPAPVGMSPAEIRMLRNRVHVLQRPIAAVLERIETLRQCCRGSAVWSRSSPSAFEEAPIPFAILRILRALV